jgi:starvation-inducible DNA-binding protein
MMETKNDLKSAVRERVGKLLVQHVADTLDLFSQVKQAHWNVRGPQFRELHLLFDELAGALSLQNDEIAERAIQLGCEVPGTIRAAAKSSSLDEYELLAGDGQAHVEGITTQLSAYGAKIRKSIDVTDDAGDMVTSDLLIGVAAQADKYLWMLEAHLDRASAGDASRARPLRKSA